MKQPVLTSGQLSWRRHLRKASVHARKRGALGKLRTLAHSVAHSKFQQYIANPLLVYLLEPFGINVRAAYVKQYGEDMTAFLLDGKPLPMTAEEVEAAESLKTSVGTQGHVDHGMVYA